MSDASEDVTYVLDSEALLKIPELVGKKLQICLTALYLHIKAGTVTFPDDVVKECVAIAPEDQITVWLTAVKAARKYCKQAYENSVAVLDVCPGLIDEDAKDDPVALFVAALGDYLSDIGREFVIVTEERHSLPTRMCLFDACIELEYNVTGVADFLEELGLLEITS